MKQPAVNADLISSVDFLPTICEAAGVAIPDHIDGRSFLPQLCGEAGKPREWLYSWYSPRQRVDLKVRECAFDHHYKLYRTGEFFDLAADPFENQPLQPDQQQDAAAVGVAKLQRVLDAFQDARPERLDRQLRVQAPSGQKPKKTRN